MKNIINKGSVNAGKNGYGITNIITEARNVVSMGDVTGSSGSYTFWNVSTDVHLFYGLDGKCNNCDGATLFKHNTSTGFYEVVGTGQHVDDLLNDESVKQCFRKMWTSDLELVDSWIQSTTCPTESSEQHSSNPLSSGAFYSLSSLAIGFMLIVFMISI